MADFLNLQNGFYNAFSQGLGFPPGSPFQILQPAPPLPPGSNDIAVYDYFNNIPPLSLTQQYVRSGGNQFFSDYKGVLSALQSPKSTFKADVGDDCFTAWMSYVESVNPPPAASGLPQLFFNWATIHYPDVANVGASDLSAMLLDPISAAQLALMPYTSPNSVANWVLGYNDLVSELANAPTRSFSFNSSSMDSNVSNSWTGGAQSAFFGLWSQSSSTSSQSQTFASSQVTVSASFEHLTTFVTSPGNWYMSSALGEAYSDSSSPPWRSSSPITWNTTFGSNGNLQRFCGSLIVASGMQVTVQSSASFSQQDQQTITNNSHLGLWPFYCSDDQSYSHNGVSFGQDGSMTVTITSVSGVPVVLGCNVLSAALFLGHAVNAKQIAKRARHGRA